MVRSACVAAGLALALVAAGSSAAAKSNGKIAFSAGPVPAGGGSITSQIYVANADGSGRVKLTSASDNHDPVFSPDGKQIAFTSDRGGGYYNLYVMGVDGSSQTTVATALQGVVPTAWSPDGSTISLNVNKGDQTDIWVVSASGGGAKLAQGNAYSGTWSPDGKKFAFSGDSNNLLYVSSGAAGARHRVIAHSGLAYEEGPSWSPDGKKLVFTGDVADHPQVWIVGVDGSGLRKLTTNAKFAVYPVFSPDGKKIVYGDGGKLISMSTSGTGATVLSTISGEITGVSWAAKAGAGSGGGASTGKNPHHCTIIGAKVGHWKTIGVVGGVDRRVWWIDGTRRSDVICGTSNDDYIPAGAGDDVVYGGAGNDVIIGGEGNDKVYGEDGDDTISDSDGGNTLDGGAGNDILTDCCARTIDIINGGPGDDTIYSMDYARDVVDGGPGFDKGNYDAGLDVVTGIEQTFTGYKP